MPDHMQGTSVDTGFVDKRKQFGSAGGDSFTHITTPTLMFTANAGGSTTTLVGAVTVLNTGVNVTRLGDKFRLFPTAGTVPKEETVFTVTAVGATGTPVTFTPAAKVATVSGDRAYVVDSDAYSDLSSLDTALLAVNGGASYTAARLRAMTSNDKVYALRLETDSSGV